MYGYYGLEIYYFQWLLPDGFQSLVALVGTNAQGVGTSPFSEWVKNVSALDPPAEEKQKLDKFIDELYEQLDDGKCVYEVNSFQITNVKDLER